MAFLLRRLEPFKKEWAIGMHTHELKQAAAATGDNSKASCPCDCLEGSYQWLHKKMDQFVYIQEVEWGLMQRSLLLQMEDVR